MGQYFRPVLIDHNNRPVIALHPYDYAAGDKLLGHTRADTALLRAVETLLLLDGGGRLVWAGDHDEPTDGSLGLYWAVQPHHFVRLPGLAEPPHNTDNHHLTNGTTTDWPLPQPTGRWILNPTRREYIDKHRTYTDTTGVRRNPLPQLTAEGGPATGRIGSWARHRIHLTNTAPPIGWTSVTSITNR